MSLATCAHKSYRSFDAVLGFFKLRPDCRFISWLVIPNCSMTIWSGPFVSYFPILYVAEWQLMSFANVVLSKWRDCHKAFNFCKTQQRKLQPKAKNNLQMKNANLKLMKSQCTVHRFAMELLSKPKILKGNFGKKRNKLGLSLAKLSYLVLKFGVCLVFAVKYHPIL